MDTLLEGLRRAGRRICVRGAGIARARRDTKVGTFTDALTDATKSKGWIVVSMKNDWKRSFAFEGK